MEQGGLPANILILSDMGLTDENELFIICLKFISRVKMGPNLHKHTVQLLIRKEIGREENMSKTAIEKTAEIIDSKDALLQNVVQAYLEEPEIRWKYCNEILYKMCEKQLSHDDDDIIASKLLIIGRTYAAAIERRKTRDGYSSDDFYYQVVAEKLRSIREDLDKKITDLSNESKPTKDNIGKVISAHKYLADIFSDLTQDTKRSLASKYLHFHCPNMFYIYDSRAEASIRKLRKKNNLLLKSLVSDGDEIYADFAVRCLEIQEWTEQNYQTLLSPRDIDNILLGLAANL